MDPKFAALIELLAPKLEKLLAMQPLTYGALPRDMPKSGIYLFTEAGRHLYVGRSNGLRGRHGRHCRPGATHRQAAFAFQLARNATGRTTASYRAGEGSRAGLMLDLVPFAAGVRGRQGAHSGDGIPIRRGSRPEPAGAARDQCPSVVLATPYNDLCRTH